MINNLFFGIVGINMFIIGAVMFIEVIVMSVKRERSILAVSLKCLDQCGGLRPMAFRWLGSAMRKGLLGSPLPPPYWAGAGGEKVRIRAGRQSRVKRYLQN